MKNGPASEAKKGLVEALRSLLGGDGPDARKTALANFETTVERILQTHGKAVLGRLHFLNLEELVIRKGGGQKTRLKKIENVFLSVVGENLKEGEIYIRPDVKSVFFLFPSLTREAGELKCAAIADQITRALIDEDPIFADLRSEKSTQNIDRKTWNASRAARRASAALATGGANAGEAAGRDTAATSSAVGAAGRPLEGIQAVYQAIWNVRSRMITSYAVLPLRRQSDGTVRAGKSILGADAGFALVAALDAFMLRESLGRLQEMTNAGQRILIVLPVHFTTVDNQTLFLPYRQELAALPEEQRKYVVIEILRAPDTIPAFRIKDLIARLRPFARCVLARLPSDSAFIRPWAESGALGVGFSAGDERLSEKQFMERMDAFVARAEKDGVHAYVHDLATASLVTAAVAAGFRYVGGDAIMPESDAPKPIEPFECQNIFARTVGA
jgi:EAL domain-containing protein (putative c-di-GMP-specific phosphodiesterase class I)